MYFIAMIVGIIGFGYWFGFESSNIAIHSAFAVAGYVTAKL